MAVSERIVADVAAQIGAGGWREADIGGLARRCRDEVDTASPPGCSVPRRRGSQHRDDLDVDDPHLRRDPRSRPGAGRPRATPRSASTPVRPTAPRFPSGRDPPVIVPTPCAAPRAAATAADTACAVGWVFNNELDQPLDQFVRSGLGRGGHLRAGVRVAPRRRRPAHAGRDRQRHRPHDGALHAALRHRRRL